jgi:hypothetical protein
MRNYFYSLIKVDILLLFASILLTILSQHPSLLENGLGRIFLLIWSIPIIRFTVSKSITFDKVLVVPISIYIIFGFFLLLAEAITGDRYLDIPNLYNLSLMMAIMLIGYFFASKITENEFIILLFWSCLIGGFILSYGIYASSFKVNFNIMSIQYAYSAKNSASQIVFSCFVFILLMPSSTKFLLLKYPVLLFMGYIIILMKSRATILCFVVLILLIIIKSDNRKLKIYTTFFVIAGIISILYFGNLSKYFIEGVLLGGRNVNNLEDVSSGRMSMIYSFPTLFYDNLFFGRGYYFLESFPLATIVQVGIIGSTIIFSLLLWVFRSIKTKFYFHNPLDLSIIILFYSYMLNSLFEEQAPFGPGAKSFLFWLSFGFVLYKRNFFKIIRFKNNKV